MKNIEMNKATMRYAARQQQLLLAQSLIAVMVVLDIPRVTVCFASPQVAGGQTRKSERSARKEKAGTRERSKPENGLLAALTLAAEAGETATVLALLAKGANVNGRGKNGRTPLMAAVHKDRLDTAKALLENGADVNAVSRGGVTALLVAANRGRAPIIRLLLSKGAAVNSRATDGALGSTALILASLHGDEESVNVLLENGADVKARDDDGITALMWACEGKRERYVGVVRSLLEKGADVNLKNRVGRTALMFAVMYSNPAIVKLLLDRGAEVNLRYDGGMTALMIAVALDDEESATALVEKGADINMRDDKGRSALTIATRKGIGMVKILAGSSKDTTGAAASPPASRALSKEEQLLDRAHDAFFAHNDDEALELVRQVLQLAPQNADSYLLQGRIYERRGDLERANDALKTAIFWKPTLVAAHVLLGRIAVLKNDCSTARAWVNKALQIDLGHAEALALSRLVDLKCK
jgi:ankyrin repeat protein